MIFLAARSQFSREWTQITIQGEDQESVCNILVAKLQVADFEVEIEDESGEMIPFEEFDHG